MIFLSDLTIDITRSTFRRVAITPIIVNLNNSDITGTEFIVFLLHISTGVLSYGAPLFGKSSKKNSLSATELSKKLNELDGREFASKYEKGFPDE